MALAYTPLETVVNWCYIVMPCIRARFKCCNRAVACCCLCVVHWNIYLWNYWKKYVCATFYIFLFSLTSVNLWHHSVVWHFMRRLYYIYSTVEPCLRMTQCSNKSVFENKIRGILKLCLHTKCQSSCSKPGISTLVGSSVAFLLAPVLFWQMLSVGSLNHLLRFARTGIMCSTTCTSGDTRAVVI